MCSIETLLQNNAAWAKKKLLEDPQYFEKHAQGQSPKYLWIGCSDSRVMANELVGLDAGKLFVHRNIANVCPHTDFNFLSVLEFAIEGLKVEHIIVCGHTGCGGIQAALQGCSLKFTENWLRHIQDVYTKHETELDSLPPIEKEKRLVELNVQTQVQNIEKTSIVKRAFLEKRPLTLHAWVYALETGKIQALGCVSS